MRSASGQITPPKWRHNPAFSNASQAAANNLAIPQRQLVYCENGSSVQMTIVAGEIRVRDGKVCGIDEEAIKREAREFAREIGDEIARAQSSAQELEPYYREMYLRAAATDVGMNRWAGSHSGKAGQTDVI